MKSTTRHAKDLGFEPFLADRAWCWDNHLEQDVQGRKTSPWKKYVMVIFCQCNFYPEGTKRDAPPPLLLTGTTILPLLSQVEGLSLDDEKLKALYNRYATTHTHYPPSPSLSPPGWIKSEPKVGYTQCWCCDFMGFELGEGTPASAKVNWL